MIIRYSRNREPNNHRSNLESRGAGRRWRFSHYRRPRARIYLAPSWAGNERGLHHAIECLAPDELADAIEGFAYFGFDDITVWLRAASSDPVLKEWTYETEVAALYRYAEFIPDDDSLVTRFEAVYQRRNSEFAPMPKTAITKCDQNWS